MTAASGYAGGKRYGQGMSRGGRGVGSTGWQPRRRCATPARGAATDDRWWMGRPRNMTTVQGPLPTGHEEGYNGPRSATSVAHQVFH